MNDKQVITTCAEICGIGGFWDDETGEFLYLASDCEMTSSLHRFNPLTNDRDERLVLEAVQKWDWEKFCAFVDTLSIRDPEKRLHDWLRNCKVGQISEAAVEVFLETKVGQ